MEPVTVEYKIQYQNPGTNEKADYATYDRPKGTYPTAAEAENVILQIRNSAYNVKRRFFVTAVETTEHVETIVEPVLMEPELVDDDDDFTVIDRRDMGVQGVV